MLICPSDHLISPASLFEKCILKGLELIKHGELVTFGIKPKKPEIGFGYLFVWKIVINKPPKGIEFIEKPSMKKLKKWCFQKLFMEQWNFFIQCKDLINAFEKLANNMLENVKKSLINGDFDLGFLD